MRDVTGAVGGEQRAPNVCGLIITLNEKPSLYLPADDRRHFVAWSDATLSIFSPEYFAGVYQWYAVGRLDAVARHLMTLDLVGYDANRRPRTTAAFHDIVRLSQTSEDADMADAVDALDRPDAVTKEEVS